MSDASVLPDVTDQLCPPSTGERLLRLWIDRTLLFDALEHLPQTFCHHDAFRRNLLTSTHDRTVAVNGEFAGMGAVGEELGPLVGCSLVMTAAQFDRLERCPDPQAFDLYVFPLMCWRLRGCTVGATEQEYRRTAMKMIRPSGHVIALCLVTLILGFWLAGGEARGQSTGPTTVATATPVISPTASPTPSIPSGQDLLRKMATAVAAKNTVHVTTLSTVEAPGTARLVINEQGDFSLKPRLEHAVVTTRTTQLNRKPVKTTTERDTTIIVKKRQADKTGKKPWTCSAAPKVSGITPTTGGAGIAPTIRSVTNLGAETLNTVPVWHVRQVETLDIFGQSVPGTVDSYISQADFTLIRFTLFDSVTISGMTATSRIVEDYSRYGEKVKVTLPTACKGS